MQSPPFPRYLFPPRSKYSPQHHVLKHPQLPFLPPCQRPSFTPIQNNRQIYNLLLLLEMLSFIIQNAVVVFHFKLSLFLKKLLHPLRRRVLNFLNSMCVYIFPSYVIFFHCIIHICIKILDQKTRGFNFQFYFLNAKPDIICACVKSGW